MASLREVFEDEIGDKGGAYRLEAHVQDILRDHFEHIVSVSCQNIKSNFDQLNENLDSALKHFVKAGAEGMKGFDGIGKATVFAGRDILGKVGIAIKFKPWEAAKLTGLINKAIPIAGTALSLAMDGFEMFQASERQEAFDEAQKALKEGVQAAFKDVYKQFKEDGVFFDTFAPQLYEMEKQIDGARSTLKELECNRDFCEKAKKDIVAFMKNESISETNHNKSETKGFRSWFKKFL